MVRPVHTVSSRLPKPEKPAVLSLLAQARLGAEGQHEPDGFEVLVRHLLNRLLNSESLGSSDEGATRVAQISCAVALPGLIGALFLFPLYHSPLGPRPFWSQVGDHFFYVTYGFVAMGLGAVLQWDLLFPDLLDAFILTTLPIPASRVLAARITALSIFLGAVLLEANVLGIFLVPYASELRGLGWRHVGSHAAAVLMAGLCISAVLIALQGLMVCGLGQRLTRRLSPLIQTACVLMCLMLLFLSPLVAHYLEPLLHSRMAAWFPPFWFLGMYERLLHGPSHIFDGLARTGLWVTLAAATVAVVTYPLAHQRRTRQVLEGMSLRRGRIRPAALLGPLIRLLHRYFSGADQRRRAIYQLIGQTLWRTQRLRLLLAFFGGLGLAMTVAAMVAVRVGPGQVELTLSTDGARMAVPILAFWTVAGLRTAFRAPVARAGSWTFRVIHGRAKYVHLHAAERWVAVCAGFVTSGAAAGLWAFAAPGMRGAGMRGAGVLLAQALLGVALSVLLTDIFFFGERAIPFTEARPYSVNDLAFVVVTYLALFPIFCLSVAGCEPWVQARPIRIVGAFVCLAAAHGVLRWLRRRLIAADSRRLDMEEEVLRPGEIGLLS